MAAVNGGGGKGVGSMLQNVVSLVNMTVTVLNGPE